MEVLTMRLHTAIPVLLVLTTFLCACQKTSSQNETDSKAELLTSTASTTSIATAASTSTDSTATEPMDPVLQVGIQTGAASIIYGLSKLTGGFDP